jgi:hypothetical protein
VEKHKYTDMRGVIVQVMNSVSVTECLTIKKQIYMNLLRLILFFFFFFFFCISPDLAFWCVPNKNQILEYGLSLHG